MRNKLAIIVTTLCALAATTAIAEQPLGKLIEKGEAIGSTVIVQMTGDLAVEFAKRTNSLQSDKNVPSGFGIETPATIVQRLKNDQYRIEFSTDFMDSDHKPRLATFSAIVDANQLKRIDFPKGVAYSSPADSKNDVKPVQPVQLPEHRQGLRIELSDLRGIKLRTWVLKDEVGN